MALFVFICTNCGYERRLSINCSAPVARQIGGTCPKCGRVYTRNPMPDIQVPNTASAAGEMLTEYGPLEPSLVQQVENLERSALEQIKACQKSHGETRCDCWLSVRNYCQVVWDREGRESPMGFRVGMLWDSCERQQRQPRRNDVYQEVSEWKGPTYSDGKTAAEWKEEKFKENR